MALVDIRNQPPVPSYQCRNCGRVIAPHEQPYTYGNQIICPNCCASLVAAHEPLTPPPVVQHSTTYVYTPYRKKPRTLVKVAAGIALIGLPLICIPPIGVTLLIIAGCVALVGIITDS